MAVVEVMVLLRHDEVVCQSVLVVVEGMVVAESESIAYLYSCLSKAMRLDCSLPKLCLVPRDYSIVDVRLRRI